jgi:glutamate synthase domain-containing protein 1
MLRNEGFEHIPSACAISSIMDRSGTRFDGNDIIASIALMHERSNGLGGGFAAYGIYPEFADHYALHVFYDTPESRETTEAFLAKHFSIESAGKLPTRKNKLVTSTPIIWRYFVKPEWSRLELSQLDEDEYTARIVMRINNDFDGAYVFSSGKNMGAFKGVGFPEDIGDFFKLDTYKGYLWTAHGRFPTNTPGWWGGAHPFTMLDLAVVHNGEISSYDANRRYIEMFGYKCSLMTDTEVMAYLLDMLIRKHKLPLEYASKIMAAPDWEIIETLSEEEQKLFKLLRLTYSGALINGPFSIICSFSGGMMALGDRLKLRSLVAAERGSMLYCSSEESAIRLICPEPDRIWAPRGGEPVIGMLEGGAQE